MCTTSPLPSLPILPALLRPAVKSSRLLHLLRHHRCSANMPRMCLLPKEVDVMASGEGCEWKGERSIIPDGSWIFVSKFGGRLAVTQAYVWSNCFLVSWPCEFLHRNVRMPVMLALKTEEVSMRPFSEELSTVPGTWPLHRATLPGPLSAWGTLSPGSKLHSSVW